MNAYFKEARKFFDRNSFSINKTFEEEKKDFIKYAEYLSNLDNETRNQVVRLGIKFIEEITNGDISKYTSVEHDIKRNIELDLLISNYPISIHFLRKVILKEPLQTTYNIIDNAVYIEWLNLLRERHQEAVKYKIVNSKSNPGRPLDPSLPQEELEKIVLECINDANKSNKFIHQNGKRVGKANKNQICDYILKIKPEWENFSKRGLRDRITKALPDEMK